jgi:hypothetical protein
MSGKISKSNFIIHISIIEEKKGGKNEEEYAYIQNTMKYNYLFYTKVELLQGLIEDRRLSTTYNIIYYYIYITYILLL